jgi:DNA polymerase-1
MYGMGPVSLISLNSTRFVSEVAPLISIPAQHLAAQKVSSKSQCYHAVFFLHFFDFFLPNSSSQLNISVQEATSFMQDMDRAYAGIGRYQQLLIAKAMQDGYVETITGRRRKLLRKSIGSLTSEEKGELHRQAVNSVIQGSAADIIKLAMLRMDEKIQEWHLTPSPQLVMQIHDELIFSCPDDEESVRALINTLKEVMEESVPRDFMIATKLKISVAAGKQWGSMIQIN